MAQNISQIPAPRVPLVDLQTNTVSREWFVWFNNVYSITGGGSGITQVINGGTGLGTLPSNGQLLIGNGSGYTLRTLFAGAGISVTNGAGAISLANTGVLSNIAGTGISVSGATGNVTLTNTLPDKTVVLTGAGTTVVSGTYPNFTITSNDAYVGTVTSVVGTGTVNGITLTGTVTTSGSLTLGGTLSGVSLTTQVSGTLPIANGGTGTTSTTFASLTTNVSGILPVANGGTGTGAGYLVAGLPGAGTAGRRSWVTDALSPAFGAAVVGGGAVVIPVFDTGAAWIVG